VSLASTLSIPLAVVTSVPSQDPRPLSTLLEFAPGAMIWTFLAFGLGLVAMWKFVYGPITKALEDRDKKVEDSIAAAEAARKEAQAQMAGAKAELEKAQAAAKRLVDEAMARAERQAADAVRAADERAKAELQRARDTIAAEKRQAMQEMRALCVDLVITATGRLLQQEIDVGKNRPLVQQFVAAADKGVAAADRGGR
jgi:F-type H+-transporting ATPase subunit b